MYVYLIYICSLAIKLVQKIIRAIFLTSALSLTLSQILVDVIKMPQVVGTKVRTQDVIF